MKWVQKMKGRMQNVTAAVSRFPLTALFLVIAAAMISMDIQEESFENPELMLASFVGALAGATAQMAWERFFRGQSKFRLILFAGAVLLAILFYFAIRNDIGVMDLRVFLRTMVLLFSLFIAFIWIPTIRQPRIAFSDSFTAAFKALFITILFSIVLMVGIVAILSATSVLLISVDYRLYMHAGNLIGSLFAPLFFLSSIPVYPLPSEPEPAEEVKTAINVPKMLNGLLTYIVIPIVMVFTVILALYILMNIGQDFWVDNLLEPMLVTYSITVILVMLLIGRLENKIAAAFRMIFPKILFFIVLLQTIASIIQINEKGLTVGRYYVILFGVFAIISSVIFSIWPRQKNGLVAVVLIIFSVVSIIPPVDAFTVSKNGQIAFLRSVLEDNQMLENNRVIPRSDLPAEEQQKVLETVRDLEQQDAIDEVEFLPEDFSLATTFEETFGFDTIGETAQDYTYTFFDWQTEMILDVSAYNAMTKVQLNTIPPAGPTEFAQTIEVANENYQLVIEEADNGFVLHLLDDQEDVVIEKNLNELVNELSAVSQANGETLTLEEALFSEENETAVMDIVVLQTNREMSSDTFYLEAFVFVGLK